MAYTERMLGMHDPLALFAATIVVTIAVVRIALYFAPDLNVYVGKYNVHHLYTGAVMLIIDAVFLMEGVINGYTIIFAGVATALILDELGYLVTAKVADAPYFKKKSVVEMLYSVAATLLLTAVLSVLLR